MIERRRLQRSVDVGSTVLSSGAGPRPRHDQRTRPISLDDLAKSQRWVAWRVEQRTNKNDGRTYETKIPYDPNSLQQARIPTDPMTWGTRIEAERRWRRLRGPDDIGGVGVVLGPLDDGTLLMGIDLDRCFNPRTDAIKPWAVEIIERFDTYAEVSPSGKGVKLFFLVASDDVDAVMGLLGFNEKGQPKTRKTFAAGKHREIAIDRARFYAVTGDRLKNFPKALTTVEIDDVRWFIEQAGPRYQALHGINSSIERGTARDESRSGYAFRFMTSRKAAGDSYEAACAAIRADPGKAGEWARRVDERQLQRAWDRNNAEPGIHSWEEPDLSMLDDRRGNLPGFPLDTLRPGWLRDWVQRAAHGTGTTVDHVAVPLLGIASSLIGTGRRVLASKSWSEPLTCWVAVIGFSGTGKTPGLDATRKPLAEVEYERKHENDALKRAHAERVERAWAAKKQWLAEVKKALADDRETPPKPDDAYEPDDLVIPRLYTTDSTIERMTVLLQARPQGMMLLTDELAGWFQNMSRYSGGQDNQFWLMAWDGRPYNVERMGRPSIELDHLLVGVVGGLQPDKLAEVFKGAADGLYARFQYAWPETAPYRTLTDTVEEKDRDIIEMFDRLSRLPKLDQSSIRLTPKAIEAFERLRKHVYDEANKLEGREREWWAKVPSQVLRLAGTVAFLRWGIVGGVEPSEIMVQYVTAATRLVLEYFWPHSRAALRQIGLSEHHADARRVLRWIAATGQQQVAREGIRRNALAQSRNADETQALLDGLSKAGWLRRIDKPSGGRPTIRWQVNPKLFGILKEK